MTQKILVVGKPNKLQQQMLDKLESFGYEITIDVEYKFNGHEYDMCLFDEMSEDNEPFVLHPESL